MKKRNSGIKKALDVEVISADDIEVSNNGNGFITDGSVTDEKFDDIVDSQHEARFGDSRKRKVSIGEKAAKLFKFPKVKVNFERLPLVLDLSMLILLLGLMVTCCVVFITNLLINPDIVVLAFSLVGAIIFSYLSRQLISE